MILVTGASGFVGATLYGDLNVRKFGVRSTFRALHLVLSASSIEYFAVGNLDAAT